MKVAALCAAGALVVCATAAANADVGDYLGKPVASIRAEAEGHAVTDLRVLELIETKPGTVFSMLNVRRTVAHLISLGRFEDVRVNAGPAPGGVALLYDLIPLHPIERISFAGDINRPGLDLGNLKRVLAERYGNAPSVARAGDMARLIEEALSDRGYRHAAVTQRVETEHSPHQAGLVFTIDPG